MKDHNSSEAIEERALQEDPIVMYLIVRESLGMGVGKIAAQCAHASQMLTLKYFDSKKELGRIHNEMSNFHAMNQDAPLSLKNRERLTAQQLSIMGEWLNSSFRKVVLRASDKEWGLLKEEFSEAMVMVVDAGLTEIPSGSETVIGLWPMRKSQRSKIVKRLQVLK